MFDQLRKYAEVRWFAPLVFIYLLGFGYVLAYQRPLFYPYSAVPLALFLVYVAINNLQNVIYTLALVTPLSVSLKEMGLTNEGPNLSLPSEPIMAGIMLMYIVNEIGTGISKKDFMRHPVTRLLIAQFIWMLITAVTSTMHIVSFKYCISRLWFIFSGYLIVQFLFDNKKNIIRFMFLYAFSLAIVVCWTTWVHSHFNFNDKAADWVVSPFYNDHTAYGAALAMFIPVMLSFLFVRSVGKVGKIFALVFFALFTVAIILSFARAGWLSLAVVFCIFVTLLLRIRFQVLFLSFTSLIAIFFAFQTEIFMIMGRNKQDAEGGFQENIESIYNIASDASNKERINRWSCAIRMWLDKPVFGWGPGAYQFKYAPYQLSHDWTIISTNFGTNGNAHSEYLGPLAEQGFIGLIIMLGILFYVTSMGYRLMYTLRHLQDRILCGGIFLGLMTYFVHGFFNNFLDTDKLSLPFFAFLAALVCFDLFFEKRGKHERRPLIQWKALIREAREQLRDSSG